MKEGEQEGEEEGKGGGREGTGEGRRQTEIVCLTNRNCLSAEREQK